MRFARDPLINPSLVVSGGGLGGTRRGGPEVNIKHSGREDNERERERYRLESQREDRGGRGMERDRGESEFLDSCDLVWLI